LFFFSSRGRHTRFSRDWSSDVCSSDLPPKRAAAARRPGRSDPRAVRGVLRPGACADGLPGQRPGARRLRPLARGPRGHRCRRGGALKAAASHDPPRRLRALERIWAPAPGLRGPLSARIPGTFALRFIVTGLAFMMVGGLLSMFIGLQLAWSDAQVLDPERSAQFGPLHGTTMMFLFAVPMMEGFAMYL